LDYLPVEEAWFFLLSSTMCIWGLQLAMNVTTLDCPLPEAFGRVYRWGRRSPDRVADAAPGMYHTIFAATVAGASPLFGRGLSMQSQLIILLGTSFLCGVPLGTLDVIIADWLQIERPMFVRIYFVSLVVVLAHWLLLPRVALFTCIVISLYHFGIGATQGNRSCKRILDPIAMGGMILLPLKFHAAEMEEIFLYLVGGSHVGDVINLLSALGNVHVIFLMCSMLYHSRKCHRQGDWMILVEEISLVLMFSILKPILSFAIYLNVFHSARHLLRLNHFTVVRSQISSKSRVLRKSSFIFMALTLTTLGISFIVLGLDVSESGSDSISTTAMETSHLGLPLRAVFVGLSALATPHVIVTHLLFKYSDIVLSDSSRADFIQSTKKEHIDHFDVARSVFNALSPKRRKEKWSEYAV
jgi:Brp/Blh family beta-carotene 15,15'-monooxygenase